MIFYGLYLHLVGMNVLVDTPNLLLISRTDCLVSESPIIQKKKVQKHLGEDNHSEQFCTITCTIFLNFSRIYFINKRLLIVRD